MPISLESFKKYGNKDLKMPYERKKVETFTIDARNRIASVRVVTDRDCTCWRFVIQHDWIQALTNIRNEAALGFPSKDSSKTQVYQAALQKNTSLITIQLLFKELL